MNFRYLFPYKLEGNMQAWWKVLWGLSEYDSQNKNLQVIFLKLNNFWIKNDIYGTWRKIITKHKDRITWFSNLSSGHIPKGIEISMSKRCLQSQVHCSILHNSQDVEIIYVSINRGIDKENVVIYTNGVLVSP